jgi:hypothetical protein
MTRAHSRGAQDGNKNLPSSDETRSSETEQQIIQLAQDDLNKYIGQQAEENDDVIEKINSWRSELSARVPPSIDSFKSAVDLKLNDAQRELLRFYKDLLSRQQEYRYFKTINRLNRDAVLPSSYFVSCSLLVFMLVLDGALNAYFFKDTNPYGLVGGFLFAGIISFFNILVGFSAGLIPWRYMSHRIRLHLVWAFPLLVLFFSVIALFNLAVGHYRDLLTANKDAQPEAAIWALIASPFELKSLQSFLLTGIGIAVAMVAARKGYTLLDPYPGYGRYYIRRENASQLFEQRLATLQKEVDEIARQFLDQVRKQYQRTNKILQDALATLQTAISKNDRYTEIINGIEKACDAAVRVYRDANIQVRDRRRFPEPRYFVEPVVLFRPTNGFDPHVFEFVKANLQKIENSTKAEFEALCRAVPAQARQMLSEDALNERLEKIKQTAQSALREETVATAAAA